ncbi:serpin family protein [Arthrobacter sp. CJ23]|uniref:serpin family protein n=1 Tax=Arthrobacter sp. CJ23 TaxID=2972479 RepID=UPI00215D26FD|nr:serpin family protein [Arthrobacter sp. CJ23]UVJ40167.1 serpin family protein [Arthrobacter sp. CJ23]
MNRVRKAAAMTAAAALVSCSAMISACAPRPADVGLLKADGVERVSVARDAYAAELEAFNASALKLGTALLEDGGEGGNGNTISSPGSLLIALAMLRAGASGETAAEMDSVLGLPVTGRDEAMNALLAALEKYDGDPASVDEKNPPRKPLVHAANGLFIDKNEPTGADYLATLARHYGTGVYPVDFLDQATTEPAIDAWVDKNTGGRIKKAPAKYDPDNTFSLLNAVYFAAAWREPFALEATQDRPFTKAGGETIAVPTMLGDKVMGYAEGPGWKAVDLPYGEGFAMRLVLPAAGSPEGMPDAGTLLGVAAALEEAEPQMVEIQLPKWDHKSSFDLLKILGELGLERTLSTVMDFDAIQGGLTITGAAQAANITVAEKGTIAAAVTQFNGRATSIPPQPERTISFDRPFHYQIVHLETGLPLFMGKVADPR